jgi:hypothetical protein
MLRMRLDATLATRGGDTEVSEPGRFERSQPKGAVGQAVKTGGADQAGQEQRVGPGEKPHNHPGDGATRGGPAPDQPAKERWRQLRDRGER